MKWNTRRKKIFLINSKEDCLCPECGSPLKCRGHRLRVHKIAGGEKEWYLVRRLKCSNGKCRRTHNELPDCICPYKHYGAGLIGDVADGAVSEDDIETGDYPCAETMKHWKWWMQMNGTNIEGQMKEAPHRLFGLGIRSLKSASSLLADVGKRISPGWLPAVIRYIYNTGGRIGPYPAAA